MTDHRSHNWDGGIESGHITWHT